MDEEQLDVICHKLDEIKTLLVRINEAQERAIVETRSVGEAVGELIILQQQ